MSAARLVLVALIFVISAGVPGSRAQTAGDAAWSAVQQLPPGQRLALDLTNMRRHDGVFLTVVNDSISVRSKGRAMTFQRSEVSRVSVRGPSKRLRNTAIGAAIGAGAGALAASANTGRSERGFVMGVNTLIGLGVGAAVGAALPANRYRVIYPG